MDFGIIAADVVAMLTPYLATFTQKSAEAFGKKAPEVVENFYHYIVEKFKGNQSASEALGELSKAPTDGDRQGALRLQLIKAMERDNSLAERLSELLRNCSASNTNVATAGTGSRILQQSGSGNTGTIS